jgi:selenophosphate synthase
MEEASAVTENVFVQKLASPTDDRGIVLVLFSGGIDSPVATKLYIIPNSTSGTNGPFIMIVPDNIMNDLIRELKSRGLEPSVIGEVIEKGEPEVIAPKKLKEYIADQKILSQFKLE